MVGSARTFSTQVETLAKMRKIVGPLALPAAVMPVLAYVHFELNIYNPYASHNAWLKNRLMAHSGSSALEFDLHHEA